MKNTLLTFGSFIVSLALGYLIGYIMFKPNTIEPTKTIEYHIGYGAALDTVMDVMNAHIADTNRVTQIQFINCVTCDSTELNVDTVTYSFYPTKRIVK